MSTKDFIDAMLADLSQKGQGSILGWRASVGCRVHGVAYGEEEIRSAMAYAIRGFAQNYERIQAERALEIQRIDMESKAKIERMKIDAEKRIKSECQFQ